MKHIVAKLDEPSELKAAAETTRLDYEAKRAEILRAVQAELDALAASCLQSPPCLSNPAYS